jgi:flagellar biosynthesis protein FlhG
MKQKPIIIPIASGKGGVGKSVATANLAIALAQAGHATIAVDLDLGSSNLYSLLELENVYPGIADYLNIKKSAPLADYLVKTNFPNLQFLAGDSRMAFMANILHTQKVKLVKEIRALEADYILLDLGAGTAFNTLDFFGLSNCGLIVTTFEKPSVMNTLSFMKNFMFRFILQEAKSDKGALSVLSKAYKSSTAQNPLLVSSIIELLRNKNQTLAAEIERTCKAFHPRLIFNKANTPADLDVLASIDKAIKTTLSLDACYFGFIFSDNQVESSIRNSRALMAYAPTSVATKSINGIAQRIIKHGENFISNSLNLLREDTQAKFDHWRKGAEEKVGRG